MDDVESSLARRATFIGKLILGLLPAVAFFRGRADVMLCHAIGYGFIKECACDLRFM